MSVVSKRNCKRNYVVRKLRDRESCAHSVIPYVWIERTIKFQQAPVYIYAQHLSEIRRSGWALPQNWGDKFTYTKCEVNSTEPPLASDLRAGHKMREYTVVAPERNVDTMDVDIDRSSTEVEVPGEPAHRVAANIIGGGNLKMIEYELYRCDAAFFKGMNIGYATIAPHDSMTLDVRGNASKRYVLNPTRHRPHVQFDELMAQRQPMHALHTSQLVIVTRQDLAEVAGPNPFTLHRIPGANMDNDHDHQVVIHNSGETIMHVRVIYTDQGFIHDDEEWDTYQHNAVYAFCTHFAVGGQRHVCTLPSSFDKLCDLLRLYQSDPALLTLECNITPPLSSVDFFAFARI